MNNIEFGNGFHLSVEAMNFLQEAYKTPIGALAMEDATDSYILYGINKITENGTKYYSAGAIVYQGEVLPFEKVERDSSSEASIYLLQKTATNTYKDGTPKDALYTRYAHVGEDTENAETIALIGTYSDLSSRRRLHTLVSTTPSLGTVTVTSGYTGGVDTDAKAIAIGFPTKELSVPSIYYDGYGHFNLTGEIHNSTVGTTITSPIGKIDNTFRRNIRVKAILYVKSGETETEITYSQVHSSVVINTSGSISLNYDNNSVYRVVFDGSETSL